MNKAARKTVNNNPVCAFNVGILLSSLALTLPALAETPSLNLQLDLGAEYDSNVSLVELDRVTNAGDWATNVNLGAKGHWTATDKLNLRAGLYHDNKHYLEFDEFDLDVTRGNLEASYDFSALTLGVSHDLAQARLDQQNFLGLSQTSLFASKLIGQSLYLRGQLTQQSKAFSDQPQRDAKNQAWGGDVYWFLALGQSYFSLGANRDEEIAAQESYSYDGINLRARLSHNLTLFGLPSQAQLGWRYVIKDYQGPAVETTDNGFDQQQALPKRADKQLHWDVKWNVELNQYVTLAAKVNYGNYQSNLASADYRETVTSVQLQSRF